MNDSVFKIFRRSEWQALQTEKTFKGSPHDLRDGFIHMCTGAQLASTLAKHFSDAKIVILARFKAQNLQPLKWETSRGEEQYPHLYTHLTLSALDGYVPISQNKHGGFAIPKTFLRSS